MITDFSFMDVVNLVLDQLFGFFLWLIVFPFRVLVGFFDPIFAPITAVFDVTAFLDGIETLRPFFSAVNWFIPFGAAASIMVATAGITLLALLVNLATANHIVFFGQFAMGVLEIMIRRTLDGVKKFLDGILRLIKLRSVL